MTAAALPTPPIRVQARLLRKIFSDPTPVLDELSRVSGPVAGMGFGPVRMAIVGDPTALREMFALPSTSFRWGHKFNVIGAVVGPGSMIVSDGADHKRRRGSVQAAFSRRRLNAWIPLIVSDTDRAVDALLADVGDAGPGQVVDLYPVVRRLVLGIVVRALFGDRLAERADEIGALFQRPQDYLESPAYRQIPHPFPLGRRGAINADRRAIDAIIDAEMSWYRANPGVGEGNVLADLVADGSLSDDEIRDQVVTLMGAGYDTTAASMAWILWCGALHPQVWSALGDEADRVLGQVATNGAGEAAAAVPDDKTLAALDLAGRVMRETLRIHPAGVLSPREAAVDVEIGGYRIPKGTLILWSAHLAGRDPSVWPHPERFDPDRFLDLDEEQKAQSDAAWVPFGRGARNCIGFALAQMELTLITSRLAQRLSIEATSPVEPKPIGMVVNRPTGGAPVHVTARPVGMQESTP